MTSLGGTSRSKTGKKTSASLRERNSEDEFMAAAIGDEEWLKQSVRHSKHINFDKNVSNLISQTLNFLNRWHE